jgi:hypothetical protein
MAAGKRREERQRVVDQALWVGLMFGDWGTAWAQRQYVLTGEMPDGSERQIPYVPGVDEKVAEIERNGGRLIV